MGSMTSWCAENWHSLFESVGIIGSLLFTGVALNRDLSERKVAEHLKQATQHRRLWGQLLRRKELSRLLEPDRDISQSPVTREEQLFLELAFVHYHTGWLVARDDGGLISLDILAADAGNFFELPVPQAVWQSVRSTYQSEFVSFVDGAVRDSTKQQPPPRPESK